jgi:hypothetical protein
VLHGIEERGQGWFDEGTRNKIFILGSEGIGETLKRLVEPHNLPEMYGGELKWVFTDSPSLDEDTISVVGELPFGPHVFLDGKAVKAKDAATG